MSRFKVSNLLSAFSLFVLVSIPSLKLIYSTSLINIIPIIGFLISFLICPRNFLLKEKTLLLCSWGVFSSILILSFLWDFQNTTIEGFNFLYFIVVTFLAILAFNRFNIAIFSVLILTWSFIVAFWQVLIGIKYNLSLGQNYLTLAMPLGALFTFGLLRLFQKDYDKNLIYGGLCVIIAFISLSTLLSRGAILLPILLLIMHILAIFTLAKISVLKRLSILSLFSLVAIFISFIFSQLDMRQMYRIQGLFNNFSEEPRVQVYLKAVDLISNNFLFGYGTGSTDFYFSGTYPHNIFLDVLFNGGMLLLAPFLVLVIYFFRCVVRFYSKENKNGNTKEIETILLAYSMFYFLQWNISWGLYSSYIPLVTMFAFIYIVSGQKRISLN